MPVKFRSVCFTLNNYNEAELTKLSGVESCPVRYLCYGKEVGDSGTPHLQGFAYGDGQRSLSWWKSTISPRAHIEATKGTVDQAVDYCRKDGDFVEWGDKPVSAKRRGELEVQRWDSVRDAAKAGKMDDIPSDIYVRYYRTLKEIGKDHMCRPPDAEGLTGTWLWGPAGCGKSRKAREDAPAAYLKMCNKWWDGYQGEDDVIVDDVDKGHSALGHHFKIWADRYAFLAESKGSAIAIRPKRIIITSQFAIEQIWDDEETCAALLRRFTVVYMG